MDEDPSNEAFVLSLLEGYSAGEAVTPDFRRGTKCISYVRQDQFTHI
jgi:hypothetical protein